MADLGLADAVNAVSADCAASPSRLNNDCYTRRAEWAHAEVEGGDMCPTKDRNCRRERNRRNQLMTGGTLLRGLRRVGDRRAARTHVSCIPSSNRTCGFPASGSPIIFLRRRAPQAFQMAHFAHHAVQPTSFMKEVISPSFLALTPPERQKMA